MSRSQQAVAMVRAGVSKAEAARRVGITRQVVRMACNRAGLPEGVTPAGRCAMFAPDVIERRRETRRKGAMT